MPVEIGTGTQTTTNSFWLTPAGLGPDGVGDQNEEIRHQGNTAIGDVPAFDPTARLDVAAGGRGGADGRVAGQPLYVTGALPSIGGAVTNPVTPVGGAEFRHSNQTQGVGLAFDGLYGTGSAASQEFNLLNRGAGQFYVRHQALLGSHNYFNYVGAAIAQAQGWQHRWFADGALEAIDILQRDNGGNGGLLGSERYWQLRQANGALQNVMRLHPSRGAQANVMTLNANPNNSENDRVLALYGGGLPVGQFFGFGIKGSTLAAIVPTTNQHFRWYREADQVQLLGLSGVGNVSIDPAGQSPVAWTSPVLRFGGEASNEGIKSQRTGAGDFLNALEFYTASQRRFAVKANGRINISAAGVPTFASDAAAGTGGLVTGDLFKDALGGVHVKL